MANSTNGNPWTLDGAATITTENVFVKYMIYTPTTDGDDLLVETNDGSDIWKFKAIAGDTNQQIQYRHDVDEYVNGFKLTTIDNGTLYVHVR
jgi:hypothetical protein